uniref:Macro domain-containing protein n=1 Tax=Neogobius melanostomus TaxID=47308 RepID=A0A8C6U5I6_9GOBI
MDECSVAVEGDWAPEQNRTVRNKLLKHFQSERKSGGGECRVDTVDGVARAAVVFTSREVRDRVLSKANHEITLDQRTVRLSLHSPSQTSTDNTQDPQETAVQPQRHENPQTQADKDSDAALGQAPEEERGCCVTLGPVSEGLSRDLLCVLVENLSGLEEGEYELELIWERSVAVVTFRGHTDMLDLYFEKNWTAPGDIVMIPEEQAAVLSFTDPKVVKDICSCTDITIRSTPVKVYPFYESLNVALMGADRPEFKIPDAFTEPLLVPVWRFLRSKDLSDTINQNMSAHFCHVDLDKPQVKLRPSPSFLRQKDLTKDQVEGWKCAALKAFREQMNEYAAIDCPVNNEAWELAEKELRAIVKDDVELILDQAKGVLTVAGRIKDIKRVRVEVDDTVLKAVKQINREMNGVEEKMPLTPAVFHILNHCGLQKAAQDISPDINLNFDKGVLTVSGLRDDVFKLKMLILERTIALEKKQLNIPNSLQDFLLNADVKQLSEDLFTSQGICAFISLETKGIFLIGSSEHFIIDAEKKLLSTLNQHLHEMPEAFTEPLLVPVWRFLCSKNLSDSINQSMSAYFCHVDLDKPQVKLSPSPSFLQQKDLTKGQVEGWKSAALKAFREQMNEYDVFDCTVNEAWKLAEKEVRAIIKDDVELTFDQAKGVLTVAGRIKDIKRVRAEVEDTVCKAVKQLDREMNKVEEKMPLSPAMFHILNHCGLQKAVQDLSPDMYMHFDQGVLAISGLQGEVLRLKNWILEQTIALKTKWLDLAIPLQDFLQKVDVKQLSEDLFTSQGICAFIRVETNGIFLNGSSERFIDDAEKKLHSTLVVKTLKCQDVKLVKNLCESYNTSSKKMVHIQVQPQKITIAGFANAVTEAGQSLGKLINDFSRVQEKVNVESCAVVQFIEKKKIEEWSKIARDNQVNVEFDPERPKFTISGPCIENVQNAKKLFLQLSQSLITDTFQVQKPGAKKFFTTQGAPFLSTILTEFGCAVILRPELPDDEEDYKEIPDVQESECAVKIRTASGVEVSVRKADMCKLKVDAVVNSANEGLKHLARLGWALLNAAGPELQRDCDGFIKQNGHLNPGQTFVTKSYQLPCKHVIHAVGPRYVENGATLAKFLLKHAVKDSLTQAEKLRCSSVALPAIGSGFMGFPVELCAETIIQAVREFCEDPFNQQAVLREVLLVDNNDKTVKALAEAVKMEFSDLHLIPASDNRSFRIKGAMGQNLDKTKGLSFRELKFQSMQRRIASEFKHSLRVSSQSQQDLVFPKKIREHHEMLKRGPVLERLEMEPTIFQLCAETRRAVVQAKKRIEVLIISELAQRTISDPVLVYLTQADVDRLRELQRSLTVQITLERKSEGTCVHLEGLTRDVSTAESAIRDLIRKLERSESRKKDAFYLSGLVEWQLVLDNRDKRAFDSITNLALEEAFAKKKTTKITINKQTFTADPQRMRADCDSRHKTVEIFRREVKE